MLFRNPAQCTWPFLAVCFAVVSLPLAPNALADPPEITLQPIDVDACLGDDVTFTVEATGAGTLEYQWRKDAVDIFGATDSEYIIASVDFDVVGDYDVIVSIGVDEALSDTATLTVSDPETLSITMHPQDVDACVGEQVVFSVSDTHTEPVTYQWSFNGFEIAGAVQDTLVISSVTLDDAGLYSVSVHNQCHEANSLPATLAVADGPSIDVQPQDALVCEGGAALFSIEVDPAHAPFTYQWRRDGTPMFGENGDTYTIADAGLNAGATFDCIVANDCGEVFSNTATLTVETGPVITYQPLDNYVCEDTGTAVFQVEADGLGTISYQWRKNGLDIPGAEDRTLEFGAVDLSQDGDEYDVVVSDDCGDALSEVGVLYVTVEPSIDTPPLSTWACEGNLVELTVEASGTPPLTYKWYRTDLPNPVSTEQTLRFEHVQTDDAGDYYVEIENSCGTATSEGAPAALTVKVGPSISSQTEGHFVVCDTLNIFEFEVQVTGSDTLVYQWYKDDVLMPGENGDVLSITPLETSDSGTYKLKIENDCGTLWSEEARLDVLDAAPEFYVQPEGADLCGNGADSITFVALASPPEGLDYQWRLNGDDIVGANDPFYTIDSVLDSHEGVYDVVCTNPCGDTTSDEALLTVVNGHPHITQEPTDQTACLYGPNSQVIFSVEASGELLNYQWYRHPGAEEISGATDSTYTIPAVTMEDANYLYYVRIGNPCALGDDRPASDAVGLLVIENAPIIVLHPTNKTKCEGADVSFTARPDCDPPFQYAWYHEGVEVDAGEVLEGDTMLTYSMENLTTDKGGAYYVYVENACGDTTSDAAVLTVNTAVTIAAQPLDQEVCEFDSMTFSVDADGTEPMAYQWYKDDPNSPIDGATGSTYTIDSLAPGDAGEYWVVISNTCSQGEDEVTSEVAALTVLVGPAIEAQPSVPDHLCPGETLYLTVDAVGTQTLRYQWYKDGVQIANAVNAEYEIPALAYEHSGDYHVVVENDCSQYTADPNGFMSDIVTLSVETPVGIDVHPTDVIIVRDNPHTFCVTANGTPDFNYRWLKDGVTIADETESCLETGDEGEYSCVVTNACGEATSTIARLTIAPRLTVSTAASAKGVKLGDPVTVVAIAERGLPPYTYLWSTGETTPEIADVPIQNKTYAVLARDSLGQTAISEITIVVAAPLKVKARASAYNLLPGASSTVTGSVISGGLVPFTYKWSTGETTKSIVVKPTKLTTYTCTITDSLGQTGAASVTLSIYEEAEDDQSQQDPPADDQTPPADDADKDKQPADTTDSEEQNEQATAGLCPLTGFGMISLLVGGLCWTRGRRPSRRR